jgi:hypothetical protein
MPIQIAIDPERRLINTRVSGRVTAPELLRYYKALYADPDFEPGMSEIFDLSDVTEIDISTEELRGFSLTTSVNNSHGGPCKLAIVAPTPVTFGMARMYELMQPASLNEIRVHHALAEAEAWVNSKDSVADAADI